MSGEEIIDYEFWWIDWDKLVNVFVLFYYYLIIIVNLDFWLIKKKINNCYYIVWLKCLKLKVDWWYLWLIFIGIFLWLFLVLL